MVLPIVHQPLEGAEAEVHIRYFSTGSAVRGCVRVRVRAGACVCAYVYV